VYIADSALLEAEDSSGGLAINSSHATADLSLWTNTTQRVTIDGATGKVGIGTTDPAEVLEVTGNIKLTGASATYKISNVLDPVAAQDVATKAYVDAQGGGCYSKCTDSGTTAGGATPSCPAGYSSVDTWSERSGFGQWQWGV